MAKMDRSQGLGGSDMAAILGVDRFKSALDVYLRLVGEAPPQDESEAMLWGNLLEDQVAQEWARRKGVKVRRRKGVIIHPRHAWFRGHVDRLVQGQNEGLEVKVSSADGWGEEGTDEIPEYYLPQVHHYITARGAERWHVAALLWSFGPPQLKSYVVEKDDEFSGLLVEAGERFLKDHVRKRVPPTPETIDQAKALWRHAVAGKAVMATHEILRVVSDFEQAKAVEKEATDRRKALQLLLHNHVGDAEACTDEASQALYTLKEIKQDRFNQKAFAEAHPDLFDEFTLPSSYRKLHITKLGKSAAAQVAAMLSEQQEEESP